MKPQASVSELRGSVRVVAWAITCGLLLALPACKIPALACAESPPPLPAGYNEAVVVGSNTPNNTVTTPTNSAQLPVESFYNDPQLTQLIQQGVANNRELKILTQEAAVARNEVLARRGAYLPLATIVAGGGFEKSSRFTRDGAVEDQLLIADNRTFPDPVPNVTLGLDFFWRLDIWRALRNARAAAEQRYFAALERRNSFVTNLVGDIAENYYRLMSLDQRLVVLDQTIRLQEQSLDLAKKLKENARVTDLPVQRFTAEVRKNQSEKLLINQEIVEAENRINFLVNRFPEPVARASSGFFDLDLPIGVGVPSQLLLNRPDIRQAERELQGAGLDVLSARARFYPDITITAGIGYQSFNPKYLFMTPEAVIGNVVGGLVAPLINFNAIRADYLTANARQLQAIYNYQRVVLDAFTEVVNRVSSSDNARKSIVIRKQQLDALVASVNVATVLFQNARAEYVDVLLAQRDLLEARSNLIETKLQQLTAIARAYQALGGGNVLASGVTAPPSVAAGPPPGNVPLPAPGVPEPTPPVPQPGVPQPAAPLPAVAAPVAP